MADLGNNSRAGSRITNQVDAKSWTLKLLCRRHLKPNAPELADGSSTRVDNSSHDPGPEGRDSTDVEDEEALCSQ